MACAYTVFEIKPCLDTGQLTLVPECAHWTVHVESSEFSLIVRLTNVIFRAVVRVTGEAGSTVCQFVAQMTRI